MRLAPSTEELAFIFLAGLRIAPTLAYGPPFTLVPVPAIMRVLISLGLSACIAGNIPFPTTTLSRNSAGLVSAIGGELLLGLLFAFTFQMSFSALQVAGRVLDVQAGQGFPSFFDPTTKASSPLVGTFFTLAAGMSFFAADGHLHLVRLWADSFHLVSFGAFAGEFSVQRLGALMTLFLFFSLGFAAAPLIALFVTDCIIALISRTAPQINPLVLGIQIKSLILLLTLPIAFAGSGAFFDRFNSLILDSLLSSFGP